MPYLIIIAGLASGLFIFALKYMYLYRDFSIKVAEYKETELKKQMDEYKIKCDGEVAVCKAQTEQHIDAVTKEFAQLTIKEAAVQLEKWKTEYEAATRKDAIQKSQSIVMGKVAEHFIPYLESFAYNPKDARFIGAPVDFIVFDGLSEGQLRQIIFVEVKTNKANLNQREKQIRDVVNAGLVKWEEIRHMIGEVVK
jgi:predicted Holliday junction resolvase-like endonuclease